MCEGAEFFNGWSFIYVSKQTVRFQNRLVHHVLDYLEKSAMIILVGTKYEKKVLILIFHCLKALLCFLKICFSHESSTLCKQNSA